MTSRELRGRLLVSLARERRVREAIPSAEQLRRLKDEGALVMIGRDGQVVVMKIGHTDENGNWRSLIRR